MWKDRDHDYSVREWLGNHRYERFKRHSDKESDSSVNEKTVAVYIQDNKIDSEFVKKWYGEGPVGLRVVKEDDFYIDKLKEKPDTDLQKKKN